MMIIGHGHAVVRKLEKMRLITSVMRAAARAG
jgi:hypothetical protein